MRKEVMNRAWNLARLAAHNHGGKASEYIALSLKQAWKGMKEKGLDKFRVVSINKNAENNSNMSDELLEIVKEQPLSNNKSISFSQAGVIYRNFKEGNLELDQKEISFMYDNLVEIAEYPNPQEEEINFYFKLSVDLAFEGKYELAVESIQEAINKFKSVYEVNAA